MAPNKKILKNPLRASLVILLLGMIAKIFEVPYAKGVILLSFLAIGILYSIRFWKKSVKKNVDFIKVFLIVFWTMNGVLRILDFTYTLFFQFMTAVFFVVWFIMEGTAYFLDEDRKVKNSISHILWNCAIILGTLAVISGSLLKVLNWEFAVPLLVLGLALIAAYILKDFLTPAEASEDNGNNEELQL
ncbi:MAG: hypothetical protein MUO53_10140 [Maribacter sp.]|nr:hypothetical protein [Maribacter sp.]